VDRLADSLGAGADAARLAADALSMVPRAPRVAVAVTPRHLAPAAPARHRAADDADEPAGDRDESDGSGDRDDSDDG
jgi:hypothetical protein